MSKKLEQKVEELDITDPYVKLEALKKYMKEEYGVTPENIDEKLEELRVQFYEKLRKLEEVAV